MSEQCTSSNNIIRVLQVCAGGNEFGGVEKFLTEYYKRVKAQGIRFDFLFCSKNSMAAVQGTSLFDESGFFEVGISVNRFGIKDYFILSSKLKRLLQERKYQIVHVNTGNISLHFTISPILYQCNVPVRIAHSHNAPPTRGLFKNIIYSLARNRIDKYYNHFFACSAAAGNRLFGRNSEFAVIPNAVDFEIFHYDTNYRKKIRDELSIPYNCKVYGFIGRLDEVKNPLFALNVFQEIHHADENTMMWFVGTGKLEDELNSEIKALHLTDCVKCLGFRLDINQLMSGMDSLIIPSYYEGLSVTAVEAQATDLIVFASDSISKEHKVTAKFFFLPTGKGEKFWADFIISQPEAKREDTRAILAKNGYDIELAAKKLGEFYRKSLESD